MPSLSSIFSLTNLLKLVLAGASFAFFALFFSWQFAIVAMISIGIHETGHISAYKKFGMKTNGFYFLPGIGAAAITTSQYTSCYNLAYTALAGPFFGWALALITAIAYVATGLPILAASVYWMAFFNLINLIPVAPLDGYKVLKALSMHWGRPWRIIASSLSVALGVYLAITYLGFIFVILLVLIAVLDSSGRLPKDEIDPLSKRELLAILLGYGALALALAVLIPCAMHQVGGFAAMRDAFSIVGR
jgi:Zn-dependent protease